ncbi:putative F-box protein At1g46984 [Lactuca sativa]|uniref:F-box domain-containing protein n=1 Tax=Lactuca sativa TaxID=4236 RepID=A0A9R1UMM5_LACSA|nr:putative F-box protein At1g46984 [Lactuca sativa]XP_023752261.1 putative F-box protein At1g46984 [Lactuca sativa]KAJ0190186.1 hypothetical protein LSAT_V11C800445060 [Lactuca sativa]
MNSSPKRCANEVSLLPYDLIFKILLLLPAKDILKLTLVCKTWRTLISSPNFIESHTTRCEKVLTFLKQFSESRPNTFDINTHNNNNQFTLFDPNPPKKQKLQIYLMEFNFKHQNATITDPNISGFREILATCNGLILATNKTGTLLILNPTTRKLLPLKSGTIVQTRDESYGFVFSPKTQQYKAIHVFRDESGHIDTEILSLSTMQWTGCHVPTFGLFRDFTHKPVSTCGVLYWLPGTNNVNYIISMDIDKEKFSRMDLPVTTGMNDRLIENGDLLNFVAQLTVYRIQIWTLKRAECEEIWVKKCTINMDYDITGLIPVFMTKNGRFLVFKKWREAVYEYDMEEEEMGKMVVDGDRNFNYRMAFTHMNTLVSWSNSTPLW